MRLTFGKDERLKSRKHIEELMACGKALHAGPLRLVWMEAEDEGPAVKAAMGVSKRNFRRAVDRNKLKRRMREAYRRRKLTLYQRLRQKNKKLHLMFLHVSKQLSDYSTIDSGMNDILKKLSSNYE